MATQNGTVAQQRGDSDYYDKAVDENENLPEHQSKCGMGACQPRCMQPCANIKIFGVLLGLQIIAFMSYGSYFMGTVRTLERRFSLSSQQMSFLQSSSDIIQTCVLMFIGYLGSKLNKPRMLGGLLIFSCIGMFLTSLPYIIYGPLKYDDTSISTQNPNESSLSSNIGYQVCDSVNSTEECSAKSEELGRNNRMTYNIYIAAFLLIGLGTSGLSTIGLSFLDENVKKEDSGLYMGIVGSMYAVGPMVGFGFATVTTSLPEDLRTEQGGSGRDRIGCWWLGGLVFASVTFIVLVLMCFFPKHLPDYYKYHKLSKKSKRQLSVQSEQPACMREVKEFFRAFARLACNPAYVLLMCSNIAAMYIAVGLLVNLVRYLEIHFRLSPSIANLAAALGGALTSALGGIISGIVMKKRKLGPPAQAAIIVGVKVTVVISLIILMFLTCPQPDIQGTPVPGSNEIQVNTTCNAACTCNRDRYQAVCQQDTKKLYFSPCHAGCTDNNNGTYSNCTCAADGPAIELSEDYCLSTCNTVYAYVVVFALALFAGSVSRPPATVLVFRIVEPELKAFALGVQGTLFNLLVFIPGPMIFGMLIDSSCMLWQETCEKRGSCMVYDGDRFRLSLHGIVLGLMVIALFFSVIMYLIVRKKYAGEKGELLDSPADQDNGYVNQRDESTDL